MLYLEYIKAFKDKGFIMQINAIEQTILSTVHQLPVEKQQEILNFSLFLKNSLKTNFDGLDLSDATSFIEITTNETNHKNQSSFQVSFKKFLKEVEQNPMDIDTHIFDKDREIESGRNFLL